MGGTERSERTGSGRNLNKTMQVHYHRDSLYTKYFAIAMNSVEQTERDPVLEEFLAFLAQDMADHPQLIQSISSDLLNYAQALVADMEIDLDAPLLDEDE